ncbi:hypothetical protein FSP39_001522 [Pinctada imbricata]|uniref:P2X purinoreceptor 7 intracellular domain-containing protein n=1 Tax=Pinctada imbricata TaxID=66713 RepID=A0AA88Y7M2_PINIB|nr:hypothetical protein FSP39_001522 [Pinctada imbricata]
MASSSSDSEDSICTPPPIGDIAPYQFEPSTSEDEADEPNEEIDEELLPRIGNIDWCQCGNCVEMSTERESLCCKEISKVLAVMDEAECNCIIEHAGFEPACLNATVLRIAYYSYKQYYGGLDLETHEQLRYTAYRQLVRWCWQFLGKDVRVVLPSCAVNKIRASFPSGHYTGFLLVRNLLTCSAIALSFIGWCRILHRGGGD